MNVLIMGRAKTGTTVISKTIQNSLPGVSNYCLEPKDIGFFYNKKNFPEVDNHIVKIIFEHWNSTPRFRNGLLHNESPISFDKIISIVRDPRDEYLSRLLYIIKPWTDANGLDIEKSERWINALERKEKDPQRVSFLEMVSIFDEIFATKMYEQIMKHVQHDNYLKVLEVNKLRSFTVRYEDFMSGRISKLEEYLGFSISENRSVGNLGRTLRTGSYNNWKSYFTNDDIHQLRPVFEPLLEVMGYQDWVLDKEPKVRREDYSDYVRRLILVEQTA